MKTKSFFLLILGVILLACTCSYSLVFALPYMGEAKYDIHYASDNILVDADTVGANIIFVESNHRVSNVSVTGDCGAYGKKIAVKGKYSLLEIGISDKKCTQKQVTMDMQVDDFSFSHTFNIVSDTFLYGLHLDRDNANINMLLAAIDEKMKREEVLKVDVFEKLKQQRLLGELSYMKLFFENIVKKRSEKYMIPVVGGKFPTALNKVPNTGRPYRASYTDGIHHGWDFDGKKEDNIVALDDGIIIRIVDGFTFDDFERVKKQGKLSQEDLLENLDILRGNQVWLKTMKGDVAFYSHMDTIAEGLEVGQVVTKGSTIGTMGASGVPQVGYSDFHLHLAIQHNPYLRSKIANNTFMDYMKWDWSFKGETAQYALDHIEDIFQK